MSCEDYLVRVQRLIVGVSDRLTSSEIAEVQHLVDHGEPAEGLRTLAWIIHEEKKNVDDAVVSSILELTEGLILEEHLPPHFRQYADV